MPEFQRKSHAYSHLFHSKFVDHKQTNEKQNNFPSSFLIPKAPEEKIRLKSLQFLLIIELRHARIVHKAFH